MTPSNTKLVDCGPVCPDMTHRSRDLACLVLTSRSSDLANYKQVCPDLTHRGPYLADYGEDSQDLTPMSPYLADYGQVCSDMTPRISRSDRLWSDLSSSVCIEGRY